MSSRIDWRNYDYSDGPPKAPSPSNVPSTASVASSHTRDTNPYSKSFPVRRSSPTNENDAMSFQSIPSVQNRKLPSPTEQLGSVGKPKLTYRPPSSSAHQTAFHDLKTVSPMDPVKSPTSSVDEDFKGDIPLKNRNTLSSAKQNVSQVKKSFSEEEEEGFNEAWDKAESEWKEAEAVQRIISDDEEDANFVNDGSVASFANMDVMSHIHGTSTTTLQAPVSILRNRSDATSSPKVEDDESSFNSSKRRKHPWDKDFQEESNGHDGPMDESSLYSDEENEEEVDDRTNLDQYEANPDDITGIDNDEAVILKHEQYKMQQQLLHQQQQKLKYPYDTSVDSDVIESKSRQRNALKKNLDVEDEEDSIAQVYGDVDENVAIDLLQDRTKQAWSKRNQAAAASVQPLNARRTDSRKALVSFQKDTVHEFEPDEKDEGSSVESEEATEYTEDGTYYDDDTYAGRSLHSVYTKSYESEAEDLVKDLFLWGSGKATNPGRRELKYKKGYKGKYKNMKRREDYDDSTLEDEQTIEDESTLEGSSLLPYQNSSRRSNRREDDDDTFDGSKATLESLSYSEMGEDGWSMTYNYCEDLLTMIGSVCGISSVTASKPEPEAESSEKEISPAEPTPVQTKVDDNDIQSTLENWLDYAAELLFDTTPNDNLAGMNSATKQALMTLSVNAARTKYQLNNCTYYNANNLDLNKDIKIVTIKVGLPIGVVFEESPVACWVKRIFPNGNVARRSSGGKIEEGDQLASINGNSAIQKNVAEVCKILANTPNPESIELCFIRYIGTIQSVPDNQGYEVIDPKIKTLPGAAPVSPSKKFSFGRTKSAPSGNEFNDSSEIPVKKSNSTFSFGRTKQDISSTIVNASPTDDKKKKKKKLFGFLRKKKNKLKS